MPDLVATAWTSAGAVTPMDSPAVSPVPIAERVVAIADAGYCGFGLIADDLAVVRDTIGYGALRNLMAEHGLTHIEIELIERWWIPRGEPGHTYETRDLLMDAADALSPAFIKIGSQNGPTIDDPHRLVAPLRGLADEAVGHGTRVAIETMPFSAITTVPMGVDIIEAAGHPAAGLVIDAWHVFRANTPLSEARRRPGAEPHFRRRTQRRGTRGRRDVVRGHRRPPTPLRRGVLRPGRPDHVAAEQGIRRSVGRGDPFDLVPAVASVCKR